MVECAMTIAIPTVLGNIPLIHMPQGGTVTLGSMVPLMLVSLRHGPKWGLLTGIIHGVLQMLAGFQNIMMCTTLWAMVTCALLDYIIAFGGAGFTGPIAKRFKNRSLGVAVAAVCSGLIRYACSFVSGILIWGAYAPEGTPVWFHSLWYNGAYMIPEIIITAVAAVIVVRILEHRKAVQPAA